MGEEFGRILRTNHLSRTNQKLWPSTMIRPNHTTIWPNHRGQGRMNKEASKKRREASEKAPRKKANAQSRKIRPNSITVRPNYSNGAFSPAKSRSDTSRRYRSPWTRSTCTATPPVRDGSPQATVGIPSKFGRTALKFGRILSNPLAINAGVHHFFFSNLLHSIFSNSKSLLH